MINHAYLEKQLAGLGPERQLQLMIEMVDVIDQLAGAVEVEEDSVKVVDSELLRDIYLQGAGIYYEVLRPHNPGEHGRA
ncbi:MAG: hypothetical protein LC687_04745 [Actinobacteria bacterium]|nr:hypothetical protein [Actinomycetota bacterium]MCA1807142.1 hypothetical protein [Actinomycetota bacterium]